MNWFQKLFGPAPKIYDWCSASEMNKHDLLLKAFIKNQYNHSKPDWSGLEKLSSKFNDGWKRHVIWLDAGVQCKSDKRWLEAARCFSLSLREYHQYTDWSDSRSASWGGIVDLAKNAEAWEVISSALLSKNVEEVGEKLRKHGNNLSSQTGQCIGASPELNQAIVMLLLKTFKDWPSK